MSTKGDMMFYGARGKRIAFSEIGAKEGQLITTGKFYLNKRIRVLNLHELWKFKCPSIFDIEHKDARSVWNFYAAFMRAVLKPVTDDSNKKQEYWQGSKRE